MDRGKALAALFLVSVVLVGGCMDGTVSAEQIRNDSLTAMQSLDSFEFQQTMDMEVTTSDSGFGGGSTSIESTSNGTVDVEERRLQMTMSQDTGLGSSTTEAYMLNGTIYMKIQSQESGMGGEGASELTGSWIKFELPGEFESVWDQQNYMERQEKILNISRVSYTEDASIEGVETYVLRVEPDPEEYEELAYEQFQGNTGGSGGGLGFEGGSGEDSLEVHNVSVKQWIAKESGLPMKSSVEFNMTVTTQSLVGGERSSTVNASVATSFSNHNEDVSIELPAAAEDARSFQEILMEAMGNLTNQSSSNASVFGNGSGEFDGFEEGE